MGKPLPKTTDEQIAERIGIPLFECCLALGIARKVAEGLAKSAGTNELTPHLKELAGLLAICSRRLTKLTETLDVVFDLSGEEPGEKRL